MGLAAEADVILLGRSDAPGAAGIAEAEQMLAHFDAAGATFSARAADAEEADALFAARRLAYPALERLGPVLTEDVCVPRAAVPEMLARIQATGERFDTTIANLAHAGDGNLHPLLITPIGDEPARVRAQAAFEQILDRRAGARRHGHRRARRRAAQAPGPRRRAVRRRPSRCSARSRRPSTRTASSTQARSSEPGSGDAASGLRRCPGRLDAGGHPGQHVGERGRGELPRVPTRLGVDGAGDRAGLGLRAEGPGLGQLLAGRSPAATTADPAFAAFCPPPKPPGGRWPGGRPPGPTPGTRPRPMPATEPAAGVGAVVEPARGVGVGA